MKGFYLLLSLLSFVALFIAGCGDDTAEDQLDEALRRFEQSMNRMINCDKDPFECNAYFSRANDLFKETMTATSDSNRMRTAHMGAGITEILKLNEDNELKSIKTRFENYFDTASIFNKSAAKPGKLTKKRGDGLLDFRLSPFTSNFSTGHDKVAAQLVPVMKVALANPPLISEVQSVIRRKVIPAISYAIDRLVFVQQDPNYFFKVTPLMQGSYDADTLEMDMTEIKALHAGLLTLRSSFRILTAYNFDVPNYSVTSIVQVLNKPSNFLTLYSTHELDGARTDIMESADTLISAIRFLRAETDPQDNDIVKINPEEFPTLSDLADIEDKLGDIKQGLISNVTIHDINDYGDSLNVSIKNFFTNPIQDFKLKLPDYVVLLKRTDCGDEFIWKFIETTFPDPKFNGIFPDINNSDEFKRIFDITLDTVGFTWMNAQIDGVNWSACDAWGEYWDGSLWISGERYIDNDVTYIDDHISLDLYGITGPGTYEFGGNSDNNAHYCLYTSSSYNRWGTDGTHTGTVVITRLDNDVIQGTFSFTGYSYYTGSTKTFSNGSFYVRNGDDDFWFQKKKQEKKDIAYSRLKK